ncbi:MAG: heme-binding protein [Sumerlaeia bacterium]
MRRSVLKSFGLALLALAGTACTLAKGVVGNRSGYEEPDYIVKETLPGGIAIRHYAGRVVVQTTVEPGGEAEDADEPRDEAFQRLFDYISGENSARGEIAMTVPVETKKSSQKVAMTVPVEVRGEDAGRPSAEPLTMRFFLPSKYTAETAPAPADPRVELATLPAETYAVARIEGGVNEEDLAAAKKAVSQAVASSPLYRAAGEPVVWYYDPPFTLPPLRQTDVALAVERIPAPTPAP